MADSMRVGGKNAHADAVDPATVVITFPGPFGPGLRLLDNLPILPKHKLQALPPKRAVRRRLGLGSTPVAEITGLGPFVLAEYAAGPAPGVHAQPALLPQGRRRRPAPVSRSRRRRDRARPERAELLRLEAGQTDMSATEIRLEDYAPLKRAADAGRLQLLDLGVALDADELLVQPEARRVRRRSARRVDAARRAAAGDLARGRSQGLRRHGLPRRRRAGLRSGHAGATRSGTAPELPQTPHDPARREGAARVDRPRPTATATACSRTRPNRPARFTLLTQKGQTALERGAAVIRDELKKIGLTVDVVPLDGNALVGSSCRRQAVRRGLLQPDPDRHRPGAQPRFLASAAARTSGTRRRRRRRPTWERQIDELMAQQAASLDEAERKRLFDEVQRIFAEHVPMVHFAAPRIFVAASRARDEPRRRRCGGRSCCGRPTRLRVRH